MVVTELVRNRIMVRRVAPLYATRAFGPRNQPDYINTVALVDTALPARALLTVLKRIERAAGRRPGPRWGARPLDIDILSYRGVVATAPRRRPRFPDLALPHDGMARRASVLYPLADIMPRWHHPVSGLSACAMRRALPRHALPPMPLAQCSIDA